MVYFEINLIKDSVTTPPHRRLMRWVLIAYFLCCGAVLITICYRGTRSIIGLWEHWRMVARVEQTSRSSTTSASEITQQMDVLYKDLERTTEKLARIDELLRRRILFVPILIGVVAPLSPESSLATMEVDQKNGRVQFDLNMPINPTDNVNHSSLLLAAWNNDLRLTKQVQNIRLVTTQQKNIRGHNVFVARFEGTLPEKGKADGPVASQ